MYKAKIVADSICNGNRLTTMIVTYPRIVHSEFLRHRVFSRNAASSRAIPVSKMIEDIEANPFVPIAWQKSHKGMQGREYFEKESEIQRLIDIDKAEREHTIKVAKEKLEIGLSKQIINRRLESFSYITELITASDDGYQSFFALRCPRYQTKYGVASSINESLTMALSNSDRDYYMELKNLPLVEWLKINESDAEIHIQQIAAMIYDEYRLSKPDKIEPGEWHIPFGDNIDDHKLKEVIENLPGDDGILTGEIGAKVKIAVARAARISYTTLGGDQKIDYLADIKLHDSLLRDKHMSPLEHVAIASYENWNYANFKSFKSYRYMVEFNSNILTSDSIASMAISVINDTYNVDIRVRTRKTDYVLGRMIFYRIMKDQGMSLMNMAKHVDVESHATVIHALREFDNMINNNREFKKTYLKVIAQINSLMNTYKSKDYLSLMSDLRMMNELINK